MNSSIESQNSLEVGLASTTSGPRFGIFQLLSLTAGIALAFGLASATSDALARNSPEATQYRAIFFFVAAGNGLFYAGMAWLFKWKLQASFKLQPGHWLIIAAGTFALTIALIHSILYSLSSAQEMLDNNYRTYMRLYLVAYAVPAILYGIASWTSKGIWKWSFCAYAIYHILMVITFAQISFANFTAESVGFSQLLGFAVICPFLTALVLFIIAIVVDLWSRRRSDWVHWFGIIAFVYNSLIETALHYAVVFMFLD